MEKSKYNIEEQLVEIQYKLLYKEFPLEHHLETIKKLPEEKRLRHYEKLLRGGWISKKDYNIFTKNNNS